MIKGIFGHTVFLVFAPNEIDCTHCCGYSCYSEALNDAIKNFSDCGFEIFRSELVYRFLPEKDGESDD